MNGFKGGLQAVVLTRREGVHNMQVSMSKRWLAVPGGLVLGALGSGAWELAVKPGGRWIVQTTLTLISFGSQTMKDSIYREAAKGDQERAGLALLAVVSGAVVILPFIALATTLEARRQFRDLQSARARGSGLEGSESRVPRMLIRSYALNCVAALCTGFFFVNVLRLFEANSAYTFFEQSLSICRPYMDESRFQTLRSRYAQVRTRKDYIRVTTELRAIAASANQRLPDYDPW